MIENDRAKQLSLIQGDVNAPKENLLSSFFQILIGFIVLISGTAVILIATADKVIDALPNNWDRSIQASLKNVNFFKTESSDENVRAYIEDIVDKLKQHDPILSNVDFKILYSKDKQINAFAVPGDKIIVTSGLYEKIDSENELAMVLAHELGHFKMRHHMKAYGRFGILIFLSAPFLGVDMASGLVQEILEGVTLSYSRKHEKEVDEFGMNLMIKEYGEQSSGLITFFEKLQKNQKFGGIFLKMNSTHPAPEKRIQLLKKKIKDLGLRTGELKSLRIPSKKPNI